MLDVSKDPYWKDHPGSGTSKPINPSLQEPLPSTVWAIEAQIEAQSKLNRSNRLSTIDNAIFESDDEWTPFGSWLNMLYAKLSEFQWQYLANVGTDASRTGERLWQNVVNNYAYAKKYSNDGLNITSVLNETWRHVTPIEYQGGYDRHILNAGKAVLNHDLLQTAEKSSVFGADPRAALLITRAYEFVRDHSPKKIFEQKGDDLGIWLANDVSIQMLTADMIQQGSLNAQKGMKIADWMISELTRVVLNEKSARTYDPETRALIASRDYQDVATVIVQQIVCLIFSIKEMLSRNPGAFVISSDTDLRIQREFPGVDVSLLTLEWKMMFEIVKIVCHSDDLERLMLRVSTLFTDQSVLSTLEEIARIGKFQPR